MRKSYHSMIVPTDPANTTDTMLRSTTAAWRIAKSAHMLVPLQIVEDGVGRDVAKDAAVKSSELRSYTALDAISSRARCRRCNRPGPRIAHRVSNCTFELQLD